MENCQLVRSSGGEKINALAGASGFGASNSVGSVKSGEPTNNGSETVFFCAMYSPDSTQLHRHELAEAGGSEDGSPARSQQVLSSDETKAPNSQRTAQDAQSVNTRNATNGFNRFTP